jgi:tetrahydromethanopterin S-methyltransferase subunit G
LAAAPNGDIVGKTAQPMSNDTKAIIGTIVAAAVSLSGLLSVQFAGVNTRIDDVNTRIDDLRTELTGRIDAVVVEIATVKADLSADNADIRNDLRRMDDRLRAVEIAFGKVDQRLETLERLHRPAGASGN